MNNPSTPDTKRTETQTGAEINPFPLCDIIDEKNKYLAIFESHPNPIIILDKDNRIENYNHAAAILFKTFGIPGAQDCLPKEDNPSGGEDKTDVESTACCNGLLADKMLPWMVDELECFAAESVKAAYFDKPISIENKLRHFRIRLSRMLDISGEFIGMVINLEDFTDQKQGEEERQQKEKLQGVLEMAGTICHELNQPLQVVSGLSYLLTFDIEADSPLCEKINTIIDQTYKMGGIAGKFQRIVKGETKDSPENKVIDTERTAKTA
jgi:nitrogen-specific signal transduction histidine kinase